MTDTTKNQNSQVKFGTVLNPDCDEDFGYLVQDYLTTPYLAGGVCAQQHAQADRLGAYKMHSQVKFLLYNTTNLRILSEFPSRGVDGINWTVLSGGTQSGDFSIDNVNTDIVEQQYRSTATAVALVCDTQLTSGAFIDTLAILNHNLTLGASITVIGSNVPDFSNIGLIVSLDASKRNTYYIAPTLPLTGFRYVKLQISDTSNPDGQIRIGTIVFGSSIIIQSEQFIDQVNKATVHYSDKVKTEAFTNVQNDRAVKTAITLSFKNMAFNSGDYKNMTDLFETARTAQKCLWIPTPKYPSRFAVFGKLSEIPQEQHNDLGENSDWVDFTCHVDESL